METTELLTQPIHQLGFSAAFLARCDEMGFRTLGDVVKTQPALLVGHPAFTYHWFGELCVFLSEKKLIQLLQPIPGSNAY